MTLTWIGHSCFKLEKDDFSVIFDPYRDGSVPGLDPVRESANLVLSSHGHGDHDAVENIQVTNSRDNPFLITEIPSWHDDAQGTLRGKNTIRILDDGIFRIAHMGDIGDVLTAGQIEKIGKIDVMLLPVGGFFTVDADHAKAIVDQIRPRTIIPMHFRGDGFGFDVIETAEPFLALFEHSQKLGQSTVEISNHTPSGIIILQPKNCAKVM